MNEVEIIRLNIERYRRMLETESDETARRAIQKMLEEFENRLTAASARTKMF
jgi:predicted component of type VI protein secretion system